MIRVCKYLNEDMRNIEDVPQYGAIYFCCPELDQATNTVVPGSKRRKGIVINNPSKRSDRGKDYVDVAKCTSVTCRPPYQDQCLDCDNCVEFMPDDLTWQEKKNGQRYREFAKSKKAQGKTSHMFRPDMTGDICSIKKGIKVDSQESLMNNNVIDGIEDFNIDGPYFRDKTANGVKQQYTSIHAAPNNDATSSGNANGWDVSENYRQRSHRRSGALDIRIAIKGIVWFIAIVLMVSY